LKKINLNSPSKSLLPLWEGIHPVKYELFDVIHLESMHQDVEPGYLSLSFNRVKGRGTKHSVHPHPCLPAGRFTLPHREEEEKYLVEKLICIV